MFRKKIKDLLNTSIETKKSWLVNVKRERKMYEIERYVEDEFDTNKVLSKWIDLDNTKSEAIEELEEENVEGNRPSQELIEDRS